MKALICSFTVAESRVFRSFCLYFWSLKNKQTNNQKQQKHSEQEENNYHHKSHRAQDCHTLFVTVRTSIYFRAVIFRSTSPSEISFKKQELLQCSGCYSHCQSHLMPRTQPNRGGTAGSMNHSTRTQEEESIVLWALKQNSPSTVSWDPGATCTS